MRMHSSIALVRRLRTARRERLVSRAALLLAAMPAAAAVEVTSGCLDVATRSGRVVRLRFDVTVVLTTGARVGVAVAPSASVAKLVDWPARVEPPVIRACVPRTIVGMSRRSILEGLGDVVRLGIADCLTGYTRPSASHAGEGRLNPDRRALDRPSERHDAQDL
ncbi:hypothetical protein P7D22_09710 [Lichenihabitans sp. Uapishka_5]|uniref:hypothetical protein n=1 Tax=Lichenihabitans sp. Uapishka_5 TaxID=3037302 RepID=UPI0029E7E950|nr:hypothetical protein [Lichenihabitans sp. Uapishka_5]MDX7951444.1 hypothetical protein [Lichenihabitans sp. Uapishka_5]